MRFSQNPPSLFSLLLVVLSQTDVANAGPFPKDDKHDFGFSYLMDRDCVTYCGVDNQYCCSEGEACYTNAQDIAGCTAVAAGVLGGYAVYTTTYTETDLVLRTSTYTSSWYIASSTNVAPASTPAICTIEGESSCGIYCCASDQRCAGPNTCTAYTSTYFPTSTGLTSAASAPLRGTSGTASTTTAIVSATTTESFTPPATASGSSLPITSSSSGGHGLSAGAIAGIVIGVLAGIALLLLFCFCCILKAGFDGLLSLFGLGKKKRRSTERVEVIEERYSRHDSGRYGGSSRPTRVTETRKKSSGLGGLGYVGAGLLTLAALLGLKRRYDRREKASAARSDISGSSYSYTETSASSASSDRRTRDTRGTRHTRR